MSEERRKMKKMFVKLASVALATSALTISADMMAADAAAGKAKSAVCAACHGANGKSAIPTYPNLAGQNAPYLVSALKAYKSKQRNGGMAAVMQGQSAALSDADMENLAAYYSSL